MGSPDGRLRVGTGERALASADLERARAEGRITPVEFDERTAQAWAATTYDELAAVTADLPGAGAWVPSTSSSEPAPRQDWRSCAPLRVARRINELAWSAAVSVNLVIWLLVSAGSADAVHPWWIWVAGPWGACLLVARISGIGRRPS